MLDLSEIPIVDNHCHGLFADPGELTVADYRHRFSECAGEPFPPDHTSTAPHYLWALRQVAGVLGCANLLVWVWFVLVMEVPWKFS